MSKNQKKAGIVLSYTSEAVKVLANLIYTPVMLRLLGTSEYGLYQLVYSTVSYLGLLNLGFGSSYIRFFSRYKAQKDEAGISKLNGMFLVIFTVISVICVLCGFVMVHNTRQILGDSLTERELSTARILMALMVVNLSITFLNTVFVCSITAHERFLFQKLLILIQNLCSPFLTLPLLIMGYGSVGMVIITTILTILTLLCNVYFCVKKIEIRFSFKNFDILLLKEMWGFTFFIFLNQIIDQINWSVDKFLLGRLMGTGAVAVYGVGGQINGMYLQFSISISGVFVPEVNKITAETNDNHELTQLFTRVGRAQFIVLGWILSGFVFLGSPFIDAWAGKDYHSAYMISLLLMGPVTVPLIQNLGIEIQRAKNMHRVRSVVYFFVAIANVFLSIPLIHAMGPAGAALGTAMSLIVGNIFFMNWYYQKRIGLDIIHFWKQIFRFLPALVAPGIAGWYIMCFVSLSGLADVAVYGVIYTVIYALSMYFLGMNKEEKRMVSGLVKRILKRKVK